MAERCLLLRLVLAAACGVVLGLLQHAEGVAGACTIELMQTVHGSSGTSGKGVETYSSDVAEHYRAGFFYQVRVRVPASHGSMAPLVNLSVSRAVPDGLERPGNSVGTLTALKCVKGSAPILLCFHWQCPFFAVVLVAAYSDFVGGEGSS